MLFPLPFIFIFLVPTTTSFMKMVKVTGTMSAAEPISVFESTEDCVNQCFNKSDCLVVYLVKNEPCRYYSYLNLVPTVTVEETGTDYVAIKTNLPTNSCPATIQDVVLSYTTETGDPYPWTRTENGWVLKGCGLYGTRFKRDDGSVICLTVIQKIGENQASAVEDCIRQRRILLELPSHRNWSPVEEFQGLWFDGKRNCTATSSCTDFCSTDNVATFSSVCDDSILYAEYIFGEDCFAVAYMDNVSPTTVHVLP